MSDNVRQFPREREPVGTFADDPSAPQRATNVVTLLPRRQRNLYADEEQLISDIIALAKRADQAGMQSVAAVLIGAMFMVVDDSPDPDGDGGGASLQAGAHHHFSYRY